MTPEERELVRNLFTRLADLEREPRDPDAEQLIREGLVRAPHAMYALVQTVLLQENGLRAADQRIVELQDELERLKASAGSRPSGSFLGGSVPNTGANGGGSKWNRGEVLGAPPAPGYGGERPMGAPPGYGGPPPGSPWDRGGPGGPGGPWQGGPPPQGGGGYGGPPPGYAGGPPPGGGYAGGPPPQRGGGGGGFLGTAAAAAAGAIGGGLLMSGIRNAMGGGQAHAGTPSGGHGAPPSGSGSASGGDLSRDAGLSDVGKTPQAASSSSEDNNYGAGYDEDADLDHDEMHDAYDEDFSSDE